MILVPAIITLGITILRLVGELQGWTPILFGRAAGGGGAILGISWLPLILGPYFALKLAGSERGPAGLGRAIGMAVAGLVVFFMASYLAFGTTLAIPVRMTAGFAIMILAGAISVVGWPALGRTLIAYGYAARIPVAVIMYFAFRGNWGGEALRRPPAGIHGADGPSHQVYLSGCASPVHLLGGLYHHHRSAPRNDLRGSGPSPATSRSCGVVSALYLGLEIEIQDVIYLD
jgi:hypothetical protein